MTDINEDVAVNTEDQGSTNTETSAVDESSDTTSTPETPKGKQSFKDVIGSAFEELKAKKEQEKGDVTTGQRKVPTAPPDTQAKPAAAIEQVEVDPLTGAPVQPIKPPPSMPAGLREKWKAVPREFQKYWNDRETHMAQNYSKLGADSKFAQQIQSYIAPMNDMLKQNNVAPETYAQTLFDASHKLNTGSPQERAAVLAQMIKTFRPDGPTLKALIEGKPVNIPKAAAPPVNIDAEVEKRLAAKNAEAAQIPYLDATKKFQDDPANEFLGDVEKQMAGLISSGVITAEGKTPEQVLKEAYDFACNNHPEIKAILAARGQTSTPVLNKPNANVVTPVRSARPSLGGGHPSGKPTKKYKNAKEAAVDAYDELMKSR